MSVDPSMMMGGGAPPLPPGPMAPPMGGAPMMPPMPGANTPAGAALPGMAELASAQSAKMAQMQDEMNKQIMMLIASLPTPNPAGNAAASTPSAPMMSSPSDQSSMGGPSGSPMSGSMGSGAY